MRASVEAGSLIGVAIAVDLKPKRAWVILANGFRVGQLKQIGTYLLSHVAHLCSEWERLHGHH